jgi:hypothetical protein
VTHFGEGGKPKISRIIVADSRQAQVITNLLQKKDENRSKTQPKIYSVSFTDLGHCYGADYFELILIIFEASSIFRGNCGSSKNWLKLRIEPPVSNLACLNQ